MKRFYTDARAIAVQDGWRVELDGRPVKTQGKQAQVVPTQALAEALAAEWSGQGTELDPAGFLLRDLADFAIDAITPDPAASITALLPYGETDTLCYRAAPDDPLFARQEAAWEPLLQAAEARWDIRFVRVSGILHAPQPRATQDRLASIIAPLDPFALAALRNTASLAASMVIGLMALDPDADTDALWNAANLEEDWQAEKWGSDAEALDRRERRRVAFATAAKFALLARS